MVKSMKIYGQSAAKNLDYKLINWDLGSTTILRGQWNSAIGVRLKWVGENPLNGSEN